MNESRPRLKIGIIVQARMGATRLPGKPLFKVKGKTLLEYQIERLKRVRQPNTLIVATTQNEKDQSIVAICKQEKISYYTGSEDDVLDRYLKTARHYDIDVVVRLTADCPLIDPDLIDKLLDEFLSHYPEYDYFSNTIERTFPRGMDIEIFKRRSLEEAHSESFLSSDREHVTPFIYRHPERYKLGSYRYSEDHSSYRWTVDTQEDFTLIEKMLESILPKKPHFNLRDLLDLAQEHPDWKLLNRHVEQKKI